MMYKKRIFVLLVVCFALFGFVQAEEFGYNYLDGDLDIATAINYSTVYVNNSLLWDGNAWSDTRWLEIDGGNANTNIDIGIYNLSSGNLDLEETGANTDLTIHGGDTNLNASLIFEEVNLGRWKLFLNGLDNNFYLWNDWADIPTMMANLVTNEVTFYDNVIVDGNITADSFIGSGAELTNLNVTGVLNVTGDFTGYEINISYLAGALGIGRIDMRGDPWYLTGTDLQIAESLLVDGNVTADYFFGTWNGSSDYVPYTGASKNVDLGSNNLTVGGNDLYVDSDNGRVGIGTTTPTQKLEVNGSIKIGDSDKYYLGDAEDISLGFDGTDFEVTAEVGSPDMIIDMNTGDFNFLNGNVGIGTRTPTHELNVVGSMNVTQNIITSGNIEINNVGSTTNGLLKIHNTASAGSCSEGMAYINKLNGYCIDKYEAYPQNSDGSDATPPESDGATDTLIIAGGKAGSALNKTVWVYIDQTEARTACSNAGKHLCTDEEWLAAANMQGEVYNLPIDLAVSPYYCVTGSSTSCVGNSPGGGSACQTGCNKNGCPSGCYSSEGVYDMTGNVWEWTNETVDVTNPDGVAGWKYANSTQGWQTTTGAATAIYGDDGTYFPLTTPERAVLRGGGWYYGALAGPFCAALNSAPTRTGSSFGFRCCSS